MTANVNGHEQEFVIEDWLIEGIKGLRAKRRSVRKHLIPAAFCTHMKAAKKECLLAFRTLLDDAIERTEHEPEPPKRVTKVKVE